MNSSDPLSPIGERVRERATHDATTALTPACGLGPLPHMGRGELTIIDNNNIIEHNIAIWITQ